MNPAVRLKLHPHSISPVERLLNYRGAGIKGDVSEQSVVARAGHNAALWLERPEDEGLRSLRSRSVTFWFSSRDLIHDSVVALQ
jgi:hypothetical protein